MHVLRLACTEEGKQRKGEDFWDALINAASEVGADKSYPDRHWSCCSCSNESAPLRRLVPRGASRRFTPSRHSARMELRAPDGGQERGPRSSRRAARPATSQPI